MGLVSLVSMIAYNFETWSHSRDFGIPLIMSILGFGMLCIYGLHVTVVMLLMATFWEIITFNYLIAMTKYDYVFNAAFGILFVLPLMLLSVAPAKAIARRLIFLALGLLLLIGLNELSKLGLDVTAPKVQG
jgi:hypothetical protein